MSSPTGSSSLRAVEAVPRDPRSNAILAYDTAPDGGVNADGLTFDPTIGGGIGGREPLARLLAGFAQPTVNITGDVQDGQFILDRTSLESIYGGPLDDGSHTLFLQAQDTLGTLSEVVEVAFTLDTVPPPIDFVSDTGSTQASTAVTDTDEEFFTLQGQTEPGTPVRLLQTGAATVSDAAGVFTFADLPLNPGSNLFAIAVFDLAGNRSLASTTIRRVVPDNESPIILGTCEMTPGKAHTDGHTIDATIRGTVSDKSSIIDFRVGIDAMQPGSFVNVLPNLQPDGTFRIYPAQLAAIAGKPLVDGLHTLRLQAKDEYGNKSGITRVVFTLDRRSPAATLGINSAVLSSISAVGYFSTSPMAQEAFEVGSYVLTIIDGTGAGQDVSIASSEAIGNSQVRLKFTQSLPQNQGYRLTLAPSVTDRAGNVAASQSLEFSLSKPVEITEAAPYHGEKMVSLTRDIVIQFDGQVDPATINSDTVYLIANGARLPANLRVSRTEKFVTVIAEDPLPAATEVRLVIQGTQIQGRNGLASDADGDGLPGGLAYVDFRTVPVTRIPGTAVYGFIYDSHNIVPAESLDIAIPAGDPYFDPAGTGMETMPMLREEYFPTTGTDASNPRRHPNKVSHYLDASVVYGSDPDRAYALRTLDGTGKLKTSDGDLLPLNTTEFFLTSPLPVDNQGPRDDTEMFVAGDIRASENPGLTSMQTLLVREHNRYAEQLKVAEPFLSDEQLYQAPGDTSMP